MNFLPFEGGYTTGARQVRLGEALVAAPELREDAPSQKLLFGVRPEHVRFSADSAVRAEVLGTEYLGTSQIVTCQTAQGTLLRARVGTDVTAQRGDHVGLAFDATQVSLFDAASGRALRTARHEAVSPTRTARAHVAAGATHG
jgi:multiple sugar transport system ATP-binding protein